MFRLHALVHAVLTWNEIWRVLWIQGPDRVGRQSGLRWACLRGEGRPGHSVSEPGPGPSMLPDEPLPLLSPPRLGNSEFTARSPDSMPEDL